MEEKAHGGKRRGAGRKPIANKKKQITLYVETKAIFPFGTEDKMKEKIYGFISGYSEEKLENKITYRQPTEASYDSKKLTADYTLDEPLSFDRLREKIPAKERIEKYIRLLNEAEDLESLESIGRNIERSGLTWKEKRSLHDFGKSIVNKKFL